MPALYDLAVGIALGFSLSVPPGPMNALIASVSTRSYRLGVLTGLGAMTADLLLGAIVYGLDATTDLSEIVRPVYAVGAIVMGYLAFRLLTRRGAPLPPLHDTATFSRALAVGISNPYQILWWLTAGVAFAYLGGIVLLLGLFGAIAIWVVSFPRAIHAGSRRFPGLERAVVYGSGALLLAFVGYFAWLALAPP
jgi:threonine/homoserine/homoserine lactone efflux protein